MNSKRYHYVFDLEDCNEKIGNRDNVRSFVENMAGVVDMKVLEGPIVAEGVQENPGFSAIIIVDFSHISVHTFTKFGEALIDVFSCKPYDREKVKQACLAYFGTPETKVREKEVWWG